MTTIAAVVIARDEETLLPDCLDSVTWADERLVLVDAATNDRTREVAAASGARVEERPFTNFAEQRDHALALAHSDWVLFVDADERVPSDLAGEVQRVIEHPGDCVGFWIPRHNVILGRVVRHAGWYPDAQLRLLKRGSVRFDPARPVHELALLDGPSGQLQAAFLHLNYRTLAEFVRKQERYSHLEAIRWRATFGRPRLRALIGQPVREFWRRFIVLRGYREGLLGFVLSLLLSAYAARAIWLARTHPKQF